MINSSVPNSVGHNHVDHITLRNQGVWYPDGCGIKMVWTGGSHSWDKKLDGSEFNPFQMGNMRNCE